MSRKRSDHDDDVEDSSTTTAQGTSCKRRRDSLENNHDKIGDCCFRRCTKGSGLLSSNEYVEIQAAIPKKGFSRILDACVVIWSDTGFARFHTQCWEDVLKTSRTRSIKKAAYKITAEEKMMIKDAAKTVEYHDSLEDIEKKAKTVAKLIQKSQHCIAFTGAGISTAAGIGDYRGKSGKWTEQDREQIVATLQVAASASSPNTSLQRMLSNESVSSVTEDGVPYESLRPTYTHEALKKLVDVGLLKHVISQNGDGLHGLSGISDEKLSELHGNVFIEVCEKCGHRYHRSSYVLDDSASLYYEQLEDSGKADIKKPKHAKQCETCGLSHRTGRKCEQSGCKGFLNDSIINFGDNLEDQIFSNAEDHAAKSDLCLCLGTTLRVTPACELVESGQEPLRLVICNRQKTGLDDICYSTDKGEQLGVRVFGDCDVLMEKVMREVLSLSELRTWEGERDKRLLEYDSFRTSM
ncbi:NAD-dependent protein deacylase sirtuin-6-like [Dysidea avara]|uniref:NAD-dependent protein deacylase sirtuin-6-like n=1 Tax=Dysidea avara TaxID=196820 RepID=UPI0033232B9B